MQHGQLGATVIETSVAAQIRASANMARQQGRYAHAAEMDAWAAQLEVDQGPQQYAYPQPHPYLYPYVNPFPLNYFSLFHPISSFFVTSTRTTPTSTTAPASLMPASPVFI